MPSRAHHATRAISQPHEDRNTAGRVRRQERTCPGCGYRIVLDREPDRCPICGGDEWELTGRRPSARGDLHPPLAARR